MELRKRKLSPIGVSPCFLGVENHHVEAAAKAWMEWQFPGRTWETASPGMRAKFIEGARVILRSAIAAELGKIVVNGSGT